MLQTDLSFIFFIQSLLLFKQTKKKSFIYYKTNKDNKNQKHIFNIIFLTEHLMAVNQQELINTILTKKKFINLVVYDFFLLKLKKLVIDLKILNISLSL